MRFAITKVVSHINTHMQRGDKGKGTYTPVIKRDIGTTESTMHYMTIFHGPSVLIFAPHDPNSCGARVWNMGFGKDTLTGHDTAVSVVGATRFVPRRTQDAEGHIDFVIDIYRPDQDVQTVQRGILFKGSARVIYASSTEGVWTHRVWIETSDDFTLLPGYLSVDDQEEEAFLASQHHHVRFTM